MELLKKFGFWALISIVLALVIFGLFFLFIIQQTAVSLFLVFLILPMAGFVLSIVGLKKDKSDLLAKICLTISSLYFIIAVCFILIPRNPYPMRPCVGSGGQCTSATDCTSFEDQYGGNWRHSDLHDGKVGGCEKNEICCLPFERVNENSVG
jgi:hypothetical protein